MKHILLPIALLFAFAPNVVRAAERPNFVVIFIDDMGHGDLGCYGGASKTPQLDRAAREGIRFTQFYVASPICSPSRCGLLTGQWPQRWRITSFLENRKSNNVRGMAQWLDPAAPSLARALHEAGYATGHFGKWHLGGQRDVGDAPLIARYGFDESLTNFEGLGDRLLPILGGVDGRPEQKNGLGLGSEKLGRGKITWTPRHEVTAGFVDRSLAFMKQAHAAKKPFYINVWPDDVHSPFSPPAGKSGNGSKEALYRGVVENMDAQLGPLFAYLRSDENLLANTLVLIASDNGPEPGAGKTGGLRGHKGLLYEGGTRTLLITWGGSIQSPARGSTNETSIVSALDISPSFQHLAGIKPTQTFDGEEMSAALVGSTAATQRKSPLFWQRPPDREKTETGPAPDLALRAGDWKLLMQTDGSSPELFHLARDAAESQNLADKESAKLKELRDQLTSWSKRLASARER